ncbi:hypothetical protein RhiirA5_351547 [Rhizophagus irregularis]|uniref:Uncharacterized protein n=3 Tax=Rhizophagus irregularis TaxID=588596 RepID=U9U457_RHIID|nr:hypothetical protein GLOIN_2v1607967 [Rhizophagus irregularis DAOM 181602=DAOM 197198]EXX50241.1 hypothetical protein RirG_272710 [Rhizophagus irregularis DAOM 197198w]PKC13475.1 hypothetical protein RhiirA5_351547 [Rhizophagus irregularis]PKC57885.1 hypothetical protein RhiirA1_428162 [Rhizophagus irregularis]PKK76171.1 hypothetical protein RhiirC2_734943 [Rhizophagus irregularis]PKY19300.1 hypothetical protein RhiirB3_406694 [Rhizophagus irregularis]|eukprot:XP_025178100.1 hypothetical protein GLOIN_2v1607967 [Rhizophagus irregularis DAOM 181602=DAOM 197198]
MTKLSPKDVTLALILFSPVCFLATAAIQQLQLVEDFVLPILHYFFLRKDVPFVMIGVMFVWTYVITASLSVLAQSAGLKDGYDNNEPRLYKSMLKGALGRVAAAHQVALENSPVFFTAVVVATLNKVPSTYRTSFSVIYTILRIFHTILYILDFDYARAIIHIMALSCIGWLFAFALIPQFESNYSTVIEVVTLLRSVSDESAWNFEK